MRGQIDYGKMAADLKLNASQLLEKHKLCIRAQAIDANTHGVAIIDILKPKQPIIYVNKAFLRISGYTKQQVIGRNIVHLAKTDPVSQKRIALAIRELREEIAELKILQPNGEMFWCELSVAPISDSSGLIRHYVCIISNITQRRETERQLVRQATYDPLTALPNRILLIDRVEQAILQAKIENSIIAFLFLDLDRFKMTNDTLGHNIGDKLLQVVSNRLLIARNDFDTVARLGGDEFVILLPDLKTEQQALKMAEEVLHLLEKPFQVDQHSLKITGSIGISFYPKDGGDYESLMKSADLSMYHAKDSGRNVYRVFERQMNERVVNRMRLENALQDAIKNNEFYLVYQPLIDLKRDCLAGFEALLRWNSPLLGQVSPKEFIEIAEENGLIIDLGRWALEHACKQAVSWHNEGFIDLCIAVNISGRQFRQNNLPEIACKALNKAKLPAKFLEIEITESLLVDDVDQAITTMHRLKEMGIKLVIDDFGTKYSSLSYLRQFPIDKLKMDKSFINELVNKENDAAIVRAIINLGHSLNLEVLAEGVETKLQKEFIVAYGCDYAQGRYFRPPIAAEDLKKYLDGRE
jgi:diguanylate cyclase (GGDEF)-like protein/PAS domain S-box-containing protein